MGLPVWEHEATREVSVACEAGSLLGVRGMHSITQASVHTVYCRYLDEYLEAGDFKSIKDNPEQLAVGTGSRSLRHAHERPAGGRYWEPQLQAHT